MQRNVAILGTTGSIGASALDVIARHPDRYRVGALTAGRRWEAMHLLVECFRPPLAAMRDADAAQRLEGALRRLNADREARAVVRALLYLEQLQHLPACSI